MVFIMQKDRSYAFSKGIVWRNESSSSTSRAGKYPACSKWQQVWSHTSPTSQIHSLGESLIPVTCFLLNRCWKPFAVQTTLNLTSTVSSWRCWRQTWAVCAHAACRVRARLPMYLSLLAWQTSPSHSSSSGVETVMEVGFVLRCPVPKYRLWHSTCLFPNVGARKLRESQHVGKVNDQSIWLSVNPCSRVSWQNRYTLRKWNYRALLGSWQAPQFLRSWYRRLFYLFFHPPAVCLSSSTCKTPQKTLTTCWCCGIYQLKFSARSRSNYTAIGGSQHFRKLHEKKQTLRLNWGSNSLFP